ncbi:MAG: ATP-dependent DNA helicase RecG [Armatimonadota bacterium]
MIKDQSLRDCKGIGPSFAAKLKKINIENIYDLLFYFPRKYQDRTSVTKVKDITDGKTSAFYVEMISINTSYIKRRFTVTRASAKDDTGEVNIIWYNQPYLQRVFKEGDKVFLYGKTEAGSGGFRILNPEYEILKEDDPGNFLNIGRIVPFYGLTKGLSHKALRKIINNAVIEHKDDIEDILPGEVINGRGVVDIKTALESIHFPQDLDILKKARRRFVYEELFLLILALKYSKNLMKSVPRLFKYDYKDELYDNFRKNLPFELTSAQKNVCLEIASDIQKTSSMQRLVIGDVGCGKTVVAAFAAYTAVKAGYQVSFMAPTEILAQQHYRTLNTILSALGVRTALLTSSLIKNKSLKEDIYGKIKEGEVDLIIGTHSLFQKGVEYNKLSLIIIDEQHKFGVKQRLSLKQKADNADILIMTATPIPRTLALSLFGDMDISIIDQMPKGARKVESYSVPFSYKNRVYKFICQQSAKGRQAFIVCPLIEEDEDSQLKSVESEYKKLKGTVFKDLNTALLHGKMDFSKKEKIAEDLRNKKISVLVTTTVIEVGIDIPDANVMVVKNAERFGLAQLHQLRGRIGRSNQDSYCILMSDTDNEDTKERLKKFCAEPDGFKVAQLDLERRGTGEFFGWTQHGFPELRIANPLRDITVLKQASDDVEVLLSRDGLLNKRENSRIKKKIKEFFKQEKITL